MTSAESKLPPAILVVDDDPMALAAISLILQNAQFNITEAHNAHDAILLAQQKTFDLALLDMHLPEMSGLDLAKKLELLAELPFMFISGSSEIEVIRQAAEFGAVGYVVKPYDPHQIIPTVLAGLARANEIKQLRQTKLDLTTALNAARETSMAVGLLMGKFNVDRDTSFEILRMYSRSQRSKIHDVANELLQASELLNQFQVLLDERLKTSKK
jgi:DNA-binding response OmpR family regulator